MDVDKNIIINLDKKTLTMAIMLDLVGLKWLQYYTFESIKLTFSISQYPSDYKYHFFIIILHFIK